MDEKCLITVKEKKSLDKIYLPFQYLPERGKKAFKQIFEYLNSQKNTIFLFSSYCLGQKEEKTTRKNVGLSETQIWTEKPNHFHTKKGFSDIFLKIFSLYLIEHTRYTYRL